MRRRTFTPSEKIALAEGWQAVRAAGGETQDSFARRHGTSARRVREFCDEYLPEVPLEAARRLVQDRIDQLQALLARLDRDVVEVAAPAAPARRSAPTECAPFAARDVEDPARRSAADEPPITRQQTVEAASNATGAPTGESTGAPTGESTTGVSGSFEWQFD